ncbi:unnamed protein product [Caenorhabditis bovis]|uniref:Serpentine receptor class gamma n=1 Tax=Caenorhabditis bovis TaxID=2654633 RepID=A0A8S1FBI2_9PELO|nr:unnamed protein product [Caenorhabditis bovis]
MWFIIPAKSYAFIDNRGYMDLEYQKVFNLSSSFLASIAALIFGMITLTLTIPIAIFLMKSNLKVSQIRLIIFEIFMAIFTFIYASVQGTLYYSLYVTSDMKLRDSVMDIRTYAIDIFILPQAWTLLALSPMIRSYTFKFVTNQISSFESNVEHSNMAFIKRK